MWFIDKEGHSPKPSCCVRWIQRRRLSPESTCPALYPSAQFLRNCGNRKIRRSQKSSPSSTPNQIMTTLSFIGVGDRAVWQWRPNSRNLQLPNPSHSPHALYDEFLPPPTVPLPGMACSIGILVHHPPSHTRDTVHGQHGGMTHVLLGYGEDVAQAGVNRATLQERD